MPLSEERIYIGILIAVPCVLLVISWFLLLAYHNQKRWKKRFQQQAIAEMEAVEADRKRIASDLHDEIGPSATFIKMKLAGMPALPDFEADRLAIYSHVNHIHQAIINITHDLLPGSLAENGLVRTLGEYLADVQNALQLSIRYHASPEDDRVLNQKMKLHIYRIVTELIQNTIKHAKASAIMLEMLRHKNHFQIRYADDGIGFCPRRVIRERRGLGLNSIKNRVALLNGRVAISRPGKTGVQYLIQIPLYESSH